MKNHVWMRSPPQISGASSSKEPQAGAVNPLRTFLLFRPG